MNHVPVPTGGSCGFHDCGPEIRRAQKSARRAERDAVVLQVLGWFLDAALVVAGALLFWELVGLAICHLKS